MEGKSSKSTLHRHLPRLLIIGAGDVALRAMPWLRQRFSVMALCRSEAAAERWRLAGARIVRGDLDHRASLQRLRGLASYVLHCAPPPGDGPDDPRTRRLLAVLLAGRSIPRKLVYIGTTGVYGDRAGARVDECVTPLAVSARARRRLAAEQTLRRYRRLSSVILRAPGIYAENRLPLERLRAGTPAIRREEDSYTSHIHADDLAQAASLALFRGRGGRCFNICDDSDIKMGDWFDRVADHACLNRPRRVTRLEAEQLLSPALWSFARESRRLSNRRMLRELRLRLGYPTVFSLLG